MDQSKILIVGANGQVGRALQEIFPAAIATDSGELDITSIRSLNGYDWSNITHILNAAAYTNVDGAELPEGRIAAWQVNASAVSNLAATAVMHDLTLVHLSSEYVFDGTQETHLEDEPLSPLGVYAQSKAAGDIAAAVAPKHYIIRTSWVVGDGKNFVRTMIGLGQKGINPSVIADDTGRPSFATELARCIEHLLSSSAPYGTYNMSNEGEPVSWADLTRKIFAFAALATIVTDTTNAAYYADKPTASPRPHNSTYSLAKIEATGFKPHNWEDDLKAYIEKELAA